jgi:hypothetical protein
VVLALLPDMDIYFMKFVMCSANKQQQRLYGMYDVIIVLLFILYTVLENLFNR